MLRENKTIILVELLAAAYILAGIYLIYIDFRDVSTLLQFLPNNPVISQAAGIITGVAISMIFFGISNVYTYYRDYESDKTLNKIQTSLIEINNKFTSTPSVNMISPAPVPTTPRIPDENKIKQIELELRLEAIVLTAVSVASAVEVGFIGILGPLDIRSIIISIFFIILMIVIYCEYKKKLQDIKVIFSTDIESNP